MPEARASQSPPRSLAEAVASVPRRAAIAFALLLLALGLWRLGAAPLFDVDEGAFSEATRELLASGDWGHTTLNGEPRWDKPILTYWLQALAVWALGPVEAAFRLPSALAAWGWVVAVAAFAQPRFGARAALGAALVLATNLGVLAIGRAATADALLNLWLALGALDLWRHVERHDAGDARGARRALRRAAAWIGLGLLTKGPVAVLIPAAALLLWIAGTPRSRWPGRLRAACGDGAAWLIGLAVALPWYAYALHRHGWAFVEGFIVRHNLERYGGALEGHGGSLGYYLIVLPLLLLPWTPLLGAVLAAVRTLWREPLPRYLLGWAAFVLVFFSLSGTKLPHYALYGMTPLALLGGRAWSDAGPALRRGVAACVALLPLLATAVAAAVVAYAPSVRDPLYRALLAAPAGTDGLWVGAGVMVAVAALLLWRAPAAPMAAVAPLALALAAWVHGAYTPWWGERLQGPVKRAATVAQHELATSPAIVVQWSVGLPSLAVYLEQPAPRRPPRPGELALVRADRLPQLAQRAGAAGPDAWQVLHHERGLMLIRWRGPAS